VEFGQGGTPQRLTTIVRSTAADHEPDPTSPDDMVHV
jgi:hypothetical protein